MFSIQKLLAKDDRFFRLLEASAEEGRTSIQALKAVLKNPKAGPSLDPFAASRLKDKQITNQITELLARTSVTPLDPEDIEAISSALYRIPKTVGKFAERYLICADQLHNIDFSRQVALLEASSDIVVNMIRALEGSHFEEVTLSNEKLQTVENDADKLMLQLLKEVYGGQYPPVTVVVVKDLYELLEKVVDRCRDVGNVVTNVVLKNS